MKPPSTCLCRGCVPTTFPTACSICGQEVRFGKRGSMTGWLHRDQVDHVAILGHRMTQAAHDLVRQQREDVVRSDADGQPYTTAAYDIEKDKDVDRRKRRLAELRNEDPDAPPPPIPEPEVPCHPVTAADFDARSGIRRVANLLGKSGWEIRRFTSSRGPYVGADGKVLSISDRVVLGSVGPVILDGSLDEVRPIAVASWRDGGFDTGYVALMKSGETICVEPVNATQLTTWIKENSG